MSLLLKFNTISEEANPKNITLGFGIGPNGISFYEEKTNTTAKTGIKVNFNDYARDVVIKKREKPNINYRKEDNTFFGKYRKKSEIDIEMIDKKIKDTLDDSSIIKDLLSKKEDMEKKMLSSLSMISRKSLQRRYEEIKETIKRSISSTERYINESIEILNEYCNKRSSLSRDSIVNRYIELASKYVKFDLYPQHKYYSVCTGCYEPLDEQASVGLLVCTRCYNINQNFNKIVVDNEKVSRSYKGKNEDTFYKSMDRVMCKNKIVMTKELENLLDLYFKRKGVSKGKIIRDLPLVRRGVKYIRGNTSVKLMIEALEYNNKSKYYGNVLSLCVVYWGWIIDSFMGTEKEIIIRYRITSDIYDDIKKKKSNLKADFHLMCILRTMGYDCKLEDFKPIKGIETLKTYRRYWEDIRKIILEDKKYWQYHGQRIDWKFN